MPLLFGQLRAGVDVRLDDVAIRAVEPSTGQFVPKITRLAPKVSRQA